MKISFIGAGYVGLVSASCLADAGNEVVCMDKDESKIEKLRKGKIPIYEPGLSEIILKSKNEGRLIFTTDIATAIEDSKICFITVDTPPNGDGSADLSNVFRAAESIGKQLTHPIVVVTKSTVPVGTTFRIKEIIEDKLRERGADTSWVKVASNPEFLKEGDAVNDFKKPDRVIVGLEENCSEIEETLHELYFPFMRKRDRFICMDVLSAELTKYASNAMLATRISFMNSLARLCEKVGVNIENIRRGIGSDPRIGPDFLFAGIGYGGSCFPKDIKALKQLGHEYGEDLNVIEATDTINDSQAEWYFNKINKYAEEKGGLEKKRIAVWGVAFKANTDDIRESQSIKLIKMLKNSGAELMVYDPEALANARSVLNDTVTYCEDMYSCVKQADMLLVSTDWSEFRSPDWGKLKNEMNDFVIFDGRNLYTNLHDVKNVWGVGVNKLT